MTSRRHLLNAAAVATTALALPRAGARAQGAAGFPDHPIRIVVPFPAGGATDVIARLVADRINARLGQPAIVDNRAGATGSIGAQFVARSTADGYTVLMGTASVNAVLPATRRDLPFDTLRDFAPVALVASFPNMLVVHPSLPVNDVAGLIALLRANPGKYNFASSGIGSSIHLTGELFKLMTRTEMTHVPYRGSAPAVTDLLSGTVQIMFDNMTTVWPHVQRGALKGLGVTTLNRVATAPNVPAIAETLPGFDASSWVGFLAPAGTPPAIVERISGATRAILAMPEVAQRLTDLGATPGTGGPTEFAAFLRADIERWQRVVRETRLQVN